MSHAAYYIIILEIDQKWYCAGVIFVYFM